MSETATAEKPANRARQRPAAQPSEHLSPKKGFIRLLCVQDYTHGHRIQVSQKVIKELDDMADFAPKDVKAAVTRFKAGEEYYVESSQAARYLRDKGPARYRNPLTEKIERRKEADIYFRAVDSEELNRYLDRELDAIEDRRDAVGVADVNDQNVPDDDDEDED